MDPYDLASFREPSLNSHHSLSPVNLAQAAMVGGAQGLWLIDQLFLNEEERVGVLSAHFQFVFLISM